MNVYRSLNGDTHPFYRVTRISSSQITEGEARRVFFDLLEAVQYIHAKGIYHA